MNPYIVYKENYADKLKNDYYNCLKELNIDNTKTVGPHAWAIAAQAMWQLMQPGSENQAICISGESGAGKTYAAKDCINFITGYNEKITQMQEEERGGGTRKTLRNQSLRASSIGQQKPDTQVEKKIGLEHRIMGCSPLLEALGNAKTIRNDNSSRFGKYLTMKVVDRLIIGAYNEQYLLEAIRVTDPNPGERNYHIFYQLLCGGSSDLLKLLKLTREPDNYEFLRKSGCKDSPKIDDRKDFAELTAVMEI